MRHESNHVRLTGFRVNPKNDFSDAEIEAGGRLFAGEWSFLSAASSVASLPPGQGLEVAFAGRSNVGKSSLINALTSRRSLARTSNTPGRTQELIFFRGAGPLVLVDLPGYGYAAAAKSKVTAWTRLIHDYLQGRPVLGRVYVLIDARHAFKSADLWREYMRKIGVGIYLALRSRLSLHFIEGLPSKARSEMESDLAKASVETYDAASLGALKRRSANSRRQCAISTTGSPASES